MSSSLSCNVIGRTSSAAHAATHAAHRAERSHQLALHPWLAHALEHLAHLRVLPQQLIYFLHAGAGAGSNALPARPRNDLVVVTFFLRHGVDDRLHARELLFVHLSRHLLQALEWSD